MRGCYTRDFSTRENRGIDTHGTTRDMYVPRHEETWYTQTRNGFIMILLLCHVCKNEVIIEWYHKCAKDINHLKKVLRIVVELNGAATAY